MSKNCWGHKLSLDESGQSLLELLVSLPIITMLLISLGGGFLYIMRIYMQELSEWELQNEIRTAMERITADMSHAQTVTIDTLNGQSRLQITQQNSSLTDHSLRQITYWTANHNQAWRIVINANTMPLTGESILGKVNITRFYCHEVADHAGLFHLEIAGQSLLTQSTFSLSTAVFVPHMGDG